MQALRRRIGSSLLLAVLATAAGCAAGTSSGDRSNAVAPSLEASDVYTRYVEALGGRETLARYSSSRALGEFAMPRQGIRGDLEVFGAEPNKMLVRVEIPGVGVVRQGYDGEVGWSINPATGAMVLEGMMLDQLRQQADFLGPLAMESYVDSARVVADTVFDERPCQKVRLVTKWGEEYFEFFDVETGLLAGTVRRQASPMGPMETTTVVAEYQDFGGILVPARTVQETMGMEQVITVTAVEFDTVDPEVFTLPAEIAAMVAK
jgi:hypothetical protein